MAGGRMDHQAGRFVDDQQGLIFENHVQRNRPARNKQPENHEASDNR